MVDVDTTDLTSRSLTLVEPGKTYCLVLDAADASEVLMVKDRFEDATGARLFVIVANG